MTGPCALPTVDRGNAGDLPFVGYCLARKGCGFQGLWHCNHVRLTMTKPKIIAYLKPTCGWSQSVRAVLRKYDLPYEDRDIINDPAQRQEMIERSGQMLSPCVDVGGHLLADVSGDEVEAYLLANRLVSPNERAPDAPTNAPCAHEAAPFPLQFR